MNEKIFINYRKDDSPWNSLALYQELIKYFPKENIFKDFNTIAPGNDFVESIEKALEQCDVLLVLISEKWLTITDSKGNKRINNPDDFVRLEIATALKRNICVIPVLFDNATLPQADELPDDLKKLSRRQSIEIDKIRFDTDTARLVEAIKKVTLHSGTSINDPTVTKKPLLKYISIAIIALIILTLIIKGFNNSPNKISNEDKTKTTPVDTAQPGDNSKMTDNGTEIKSIKEKKTDQPESFPPKDFDGNVYNTVVVGTQTWMKENLKTTHYRNGTAIPNIIDNAQWFNLSTGAYCNLNNDASNKNTYGLLYNWYAVNNSAGLCPAGWHIPTSQEWSTLVNYLGGYDVAGTALKATTLWDKFGEVPTSLTNSSGFSGIPAGERWAKGDFANGNWAYIWSSSFNSLSLNYNNPKAYLGTGANQSERSGYSCRCIKD